VKPDSLSEVGFLPARSQRQAFDWSLVLLSQGIESTVVRAEPGWGLELPRAQVRRAVRILRVHRLENRRWSRYFEPLPVGPGFHPGALIWAFGMAIVHLWVAATPLPLVTRGLCDANALAQGEVWRLWTAITLHGDLRHLVGNLIFGVLLLGLAMARWGAGWAQLAALMGGVLGNVLSVVLHGIDHRGLGASGMVMAALGLLVTHPPASGATGSPPDRWLGRGVFAALLLFVLLGVDPGSDVVAHVGGFLGGLGAGWLLKALPESWRGNRRSNAAAGLVTLLMLGAAWGLAMVRSDVTGL
jgi:rhomboid protease GluP